MSNISPKTLGIQDLFVEFLVICLNSLSNHFLHSGSLLPTQTTLLYGVFFIMPYIYLLMIGVAWNVDRKLENLRARNTDVPNTFCRYFLR